MATERPNRLYTILIWVGLLTIAWSLPVIDLVSRLRHDPQTEVTRYYQPASQTSSGWTVQQSQSERPAPLKGVRG
jgi:hypothetical protein